MAENLDELKLPNLTIQKIIREALPENVMVAKDARSALSSSASVFITYLTSQALREAGKTKRKTILAHDIIAALGELEFDDFVEPLQQVMKDIKDNKRKKSGKSKKVIEEDTEVIEESEEHIDEPIDEEIRIGEDNLQ